MLESSIDDLDALIVELSAVRERLAQTGDRPDPEVLWQAETSLRHLGERATRRAVVIRRAIEVLRERREAS
jgi:hypothetical protein